VGITKTKQNGLQTAFIRYYTGGDTKGNCLQSMLKAGYSKQYANCYAGQKFLNFKSIAGPLAKRQAEIDKCEAITIEVITENFEYAKEQCINEDGKLIDKPNYIKCVENEAKHIGYYQADNEQSQPKTQVLVVNNEDRLKALKSELALLERAKQLGPAICTE
jgi:hypothetical protein